MGKATFDFRINTYIKYVKFWSVLLEIFVQHKTLKLGDSVKKIEISQSLFIFQHIKPAHLEFTVKADLFIEPDGVFLLEGGKATLKLFEKSGLKDSTGEPIKRGN